MSVREQNRKKLEELVMELLVIRNILIKFDEMEIAMNEALFVEFCNNLPNPPRTAQGELTYMGYRQMMKRFPQDKLREMCERINSEPEQFLIFH